MTICACYWRGMSSNTGHDASFYNMQEWRGIQEEVDEVNGTKANITNNETF